MKKLACTLLALVYLGCSPPVSNSENLSDFTMTEYDGINLAVKKDDNGQILEKGGLYNGVKNGVWITYKDGNPVGQSSYINGKLNGPTTVLSKRGIIESFTEYVNDVLHGEVITYKSGRLFEHSNYVDGQLDGDYILYFEYSDKPQRTSHFENGKQHGTLKYFDKEGNVTLEYLYENGEKISGGIVKKEEE